MRGSSGPESSSPTLVGIRASVRCSSCFLSAARICSLCEKNQNTSITASTAPRNITMVINQIICDSHSNRRQCRGYCKRGLPSMSGIVHPSSVAPKSTLFRTLTARFWWRDESTACRWHFVGLFGPRFRNVFRFPREGRYSSLMVHGRGCAAILAGTFHGQGLSRRPCETQPQVLRGRHDSTESRKSTLPMRRGGQASLVLGPAGMTARPRQRRRQVLRAGVTHRET